MHANFFSDKGHVGSAKAIKVSFAMQNKQLSKERAGRESRREYKSPTLRKLGKLTQMTLAVAHTSNVADGGPSPNNKTS